MKLMGWISIYTKSTTLRSYVFVYRR